MLNPIVPMIQYMAGCFSLQAGDVILTGTPAGVGPLNAGDELVLELPGASRFEGSAFVNGYTCVPLPVGASLLAMRPSHPALMLAGYTAIASKLGSPQGMG